MVFSLFLLGKQNLVFSISCQDGWNKKYFSVELDGTNKQVFSSLTPNIAYYFLCASSDYDDVYSKPSARGIDNTN